jgi:hypothetical protein
MLLLSNVFPSSIFRATIMKLLGPAFLAAFLGVSLADEQMKIMYYSDSACSSPINEVDVTWADAVDTGPNCYNYNYGSSVMITNCYKKNCSCAFYTQTNCQGDGGNIFGVSVCIPSVYSSFECYYN